MARGTPSYTSGNIAAAGSGVRDALYQVIRAQLTAYQSNSEDAWDEYDVINDVANARDIVFHSVGDRSLGSGALKGDTDIFIRLWQTATALYITSARDWSTLSSTGSGVPTSSYTNTNDTAEVDWFCVTNEYEFVFIWLQAGNANIISFGRPNSVAAEALSGIARLDTATSGTGSMSLSVDRDISSLIRVGQSIWLHNRTPYGSALETVNCEIVTVTSKSASSIGVSGVAQDGYAIGALVGLDPAPVYARIAGNSSSVQISGTYEFTTTPQADVNSGAVSTHNLENPYTGNEGDADPAPWGDYLAVRPYFRCDESGKDWPRGEPEHVLIFTMGTNVDLDRMILNNNSALAYKFFSSVTFSTSWGTGIGPGAT